MLVENIHIFCSTHCARVFSAKHVDYTKVSRTLRNKRSKVKLVETRICKWCNSKFNVVSTSKQQCCCSGHSQWYNSSVKYQQKLNLTDDIRKRVQLELYLYRKKCQFSFSLDTYPEEFDFSLIEKYGWYKAKNNGDNPNGVSRDHMFSVKDGFLNKVDPKIISHPANCRLVLQHENAKKRNKSCITLE